MKKYALAALAAIALAGCGGPRNDDDLRLAMKAQMEGFGGKEGASIFGDQIKHAKIINCAKADAGGYKCDFMGLMGIAQSGRFVKGDGGWIMVMGN